MRSLMVMAFMVMTACGDRGDCRAIDSTSGSPNCQSLRFTDAGVRVLSYTVSGGLSVSASCAATADATTVTLDISGSACGSGGNNPVIGVAETECVLPLLAEGTWAVTGGATLTIPGDGGLGTCAP
ncbi:MAG: hypothetical protein ACO1OB_00435 [Archangium sp.]